MNALTEVMTGIGNSIMMLSTQSSNAIMPAAQVSMHKTHVGKIMIRGLGAEAILIYEERFGIPLSGRDFNESELLNELADSFPETKVPDRVWSATTGDVIELDAMFAGRPAHSLDRRSILACGADLCLRVMTPAGQRHYLPAFLKVLLNGHDPKDDLAHWSGFLAGMEEYLSTLLVTYQSQQVRSELNQKRAALVIKFLEVLAIRYESDL